MCFGPSCRSCLIRLIWCLAAALLLGLMCLHGVYLKLGTLGVAYVFRVRVLYLCFGAWRPRTWRCCWLDLSKADLVFL